MSSRIYRAILLSVGLALLAGLLVTLGCLYGYFGGVMENQLRDQVRLAAAGVEEGGTDYLSRISSDRYRITWIQPDGSVLYDTKADPSQMENHLDRSEVQEALRSGDGQGERYSSTLMEKTFYYAQRLSDGTVLRMSASTVTAAVLAYGMLQPLLVVLAAALVLAGLLAIAPGAFAGGLAAGFPLGMLVRNLVPIVLFAVLIALGLWRWERAMIRGFLWFGRGVLAVITVGLAAAVFTELTGVTVIPGTAPLEGGVQTVAGIGFVLAGAFPLVFLLTKLLRRPLAALGRLLGMNGTAAAGLVASLANSIPMFGMVKDMDERGKIVNIAFAVPAAFVFGDHLGFTAGYDAAMLGPVIAAKLTGGVLAVLAALLFTRKKPAQNM